MKRLIKALIGKLPFARSLNQQYDIHTKEIINRVCKRDSNCIDVGCHKGKILDAILKAAPNGTHFGFEPIPDLYEKLQAKYKKTNCKIYQIALSNYRGSTTFNYVVSNPGYSGIRKRKYERADEEIVELIVETDTIDTIIPGDLKISLIKIDVEGAELLVLEGGKEMLKRDKPVILFEHGMGASDYYGSTPEQVFQLLKDCGLHISLLGHWLLNKQALTLEEFKDQYYERKNYFFIAY